MSPRNRVTSLSSQNIHHSEERIPLRSNPDSFQNSSPEFDFCLRQNSKQRFCHADELFSEWKTHPLAAVNTTTVKKAEITSPVSNPQSLALKSDTRDSDSDDPSFGCGFWLARSKSVGYSMRNKKTNSSLEYHRSNSDPQKKKKSLKKMNSKEIRVPRSVNSTALNVPLADIFCLGGDRRK